MDGVKIKELEEMSKNNKSESEKGSIVGVKGLVIQPNQPIEKKESSK